MIAARAARAGAARRRSIRCAATSGASARRIASSPPHLLGDAWPGKRRRKIGEKSAKSLGGERDALLLMERIVAEPELAGEDKAVHRALKALNRRRAQVWPAAPTSSRERMHATAHTGNIAGIARRFIQR